MLKKKDVLLFIKERRMLQYEHYDKPALTREHYDHLTCTYKPLFYSLFCIYVVVSILNKSGYISAIHMILHCITLMI